LKFGSCVVASPPKGLPVCGNGLLGLKREFFSHECGTLRKVAPFFFFKLVQSAETIWI
jgi:hypothetical protein